jgi:transposase
VNKAIEKTLKGIDPTAYQSLLSILGIGPVMAAGILSEIGYIDAFKNQEALAKYAGLVWRENQSGNFQADDTPLSFWESF